MIYLSGHLTDLRHPRLGVMNTPKNNYMARPEIVWAADNGRFAQPAAYSDSKFLAWLERRDGANCLFATAPDVLADHAATVELSRPMLRQIRRLGYPAAFVAQDGWAEATTPWDEFDVLFLGGTTRFKLSACHAVAAARRHGKAIHMGRVNSFSRLRLASAVGCSSADGTFLKFAPKTNVPRLIAWFDKLQPMLEF